MKFSPFFDSLFKLSAECGSSPIIVSPILISYPPVLNPKMK